MEVDIVTVLSSLVSSVGITAGGAWWLGRQWVNHKLAQALEQQKFELQKALEEKKAIWQGEVRRSVENELADKAAQRGYEFAARNRLYTAIGPLRFQLLNACRDLAIHIQDYGLEGRRYSLEPTNYYGKSTLYRLIRPLTIAELIERQISIADFSVDPEAVDLLRFKRAAFRAFNDDRPILNHPDENWDYAEEHLFNHLTAKMASALAITPEGALERPMFFHEFESYLEQPASRETVGPLIHIVRNFDIKNKPIFWIRLVFYGYASAMLVNHMGVKIGFQLINFNPTKLLALSADKFTKEHMQDICEEFDILLRSGL
jgi:hypothetical protein